MKIRSGFVSNSSSASFIITLKTSLSDFYVSEYIKLSDEHFKKFWNGGYSKVIDWTSFRSKNIKYKNQKVKPLQMSVYKRVDNNTIILNLSTTMFNDWTDVPAWKFIRAISENKIKNIDIQEIKQVEGDEHIEEEITQFDYRCWELIDSPEEGSIKQNEHDMDYFMYLNEVGYTFTCEELVQFTKHQLNQ